MFERTVWHGWNYLKYLLFSRHRYGHGIHSPFLFDLITRVLNDKKKYPEYKKIESLWNKTGGETGLMITDDRGAGSSYGKHLTIRTGKMLRRMGVDRKTGRLLFRLVKYFGPRSLLELGTGGGISTLYLAAASGEIPFYTVEGREELAELAKRNLERAGYGFVQVMTGDFDEKLPGLLEKMGTVDFAFIDGNHREEATLKYFDAITGRSGEESVLVFDDIYWSRAMTRAWKKIIADPRVTLSLDLFRAGVVFLRKGLPGEHVRIRF